MRAPSGMSGVQPLPNSGQAQGFTAPVSTSPQRQEEGSATFTSGTAKRLSASKAA